MAVKPDHYWHPILLPLFAGALNVPLALMSGSVPNVKNRAAVARVIHGLAVLLMAAYVTISILQPFSGAVVRYREGLAVEQSVTQE